MNEIDKKLDKLSLEDIKYEMAKRSKEIPFGHSDFQNRVLMENSNYGVPTRNYRTLLMACWKKLIDLEATEIQLKKDQIKLEGLKDKLNTLQTSRSKDEVEKKLLELDIRLILSSLPYTEKLVNDAIDEFSYLYGRIKEYPEITRDQFEDMEEFYYRKRFKEQAELGDSGSIACLNQMDRHLPLTEDFLKDPSKLLDDKKNKFLLELKKD